VEAGAPTTTNSFKATEAKEKRKEEEGEHFNANCVTP